MIEASYQKGAYYLYEYMMAKQQNQEFSRFTSSASVNSNISKKVSLNANINFSRDVYQGNVPSANLTANYTPKDDLSFFNERFTGTDTSLSTRATSLMCRWG